MLYCTVSACLCPEEGPKKESMCLFDQQTHLLNTACTAHRQTARKLKHVGGLSSSCVILKNEDVN